MSSRYAFLLAVTMLFPTRVVRTDGPALTTQQQGVLKATTKLAPEVREYVKLDDAVIALSHIRVIDGTGQPARGDQTLIIRDGAIAPTLCRSVAGGVGRPSFQPRRWAMTASQSTTAASLRLGLA